MGFNSSFKSPGVFSLCALAAAVSTANVAIAADDYSGLEEVVVTAEKRASTVQDTAIAVSAFDAEALEKRQIVNTSDLQFSVPNMIFSKGNFTGSNIAIRGVGNSAVASSSDAGVGVHVNDVYLNAPKIFETEFFDMERIEVLRGPQGTLYGRNTTAGVINLITAKPTQDFEAKISVTAGNYSAKKITGMVNVAISDEIATRLAVYALDRDGYTKNLYTGSDIDDRELWSARWTTSFDLSEDTNAQLMISHFKEDDRRSRVSKQLCTKDLRGAQGLGCLPDSKGSSFPNDQATIGTALTDLLTAQAVYQEATLGATNLPKYSANAGIGGGAQFSFNGALAPGFAAAGIPQALLNSFSANAFTGAPVDSFATSVNPTDLRKVSADFDPEYYAEETSMTLQISHEFGDYSLTSITNMHDTETDGRTDYDWAVPSVNYQTPVTYELFGETRVATFAEGVDRSRSKNDQWSQQFRLSSNLDGDFNFILGAYYMNFETESHYEVESSGLSAWAQSGGTSGLLNTLVGAPKTPLSQAESQYDSNTKYEVTTSALFGEGYWQLSDETKVTLGLRYSDETKTVNSRLIYVDLAKSTSDPFSDQEEDWQEVTGKLGIDHYLENDFTDETMIYATVARGYKGGGFNPPATTAGAFSETFDPEYINSFEVGAKNRLWDNSLQANFSFFYYDYKGLQIAQIVNQAGINENVDAEVTGIEAEFLYAPNANWLFSLNLAWLDAELGDDVTSIDTANPSQGGPVINVFGNLVPINPATGAPTAATSVSLAGNQLQNSPESSVNAFAEYTQDISNGMSIVYHVDYTWQDSYYARNFNTKADQIDSWSVANAHVALYSPEGDWHVKAWVKNIQDDDNITGHYTTDAVSGLFTNVFIMEPRTFGLTVAKSF